MTSINSLWRGMTVITLVALGLLVFGWLAPVRAAELDCEAMAYSLNPGDAYQFKVEIQSKMMRLEKGDDFCTEPVKDWFKRQLILPPPARVEMPLPKLPKSQQSTDNAPLPASRDDAPLPSQQLRKDFVPDMGLETDTGAAPLPIQREFIKSKKKGTTAEGTNGVEVPQPLPEGQQPTAQTVPGETPKENVSGNPKAVGTEQKTPVFGVAAPPPPIRDDTLVKRCDRDLVSFWSPGEHHIDGQTFWLSGVFTIDLDSDGRVDDVGFKIKSEGKIGNILNYFPSTEGRYSGKTIDSLKLDDDRDIHRLCPGNITFERADPGGVAKQKKPAVNQAKALVKDGAKKSAAPAKSVPKVQPQEPEPAPEPEPEPVKKKTSTAVLIIAGIAMVLLLAGGIGLAMALRNIARSKKDEYEDDDDEDDEA